jgi:hypothetical protein
MRISAWRISWRGIAVIKAKTEFPTKVPKNTKFRSQTY